jgi:hypothetical protein
LLELRSHDDDIIENFHMPSSGDYIGFVTATKIRLYKLEMAELDTPKLRRVDLTLNPRKVPNQLHFYRHNSSNYVLTATDGLGLKCYQLSQEDNSATPIFRYENLSILGNRLVYLF